MNKKINLLFIFCLAILTFAKAQTPKAFNYSAVARNASGIPIATTTIGIQISILKSSSLGSTVYSENHFINTDDFGLFNLIVGGGSVQIGAMTAIDWSNDDYYLKVGMDANGGTNFLTMGTTQLLSVPYALHAATADSIVGGNTNGFSHFIGEEFGGGIIFHLWKDVQGLEHGLIVDKTDLSTSQVWSNITDQEIGISAQSSWNGLGNSNAIVAQSGHTNSAAALCLNTTNGGYSDWYLPSVDELSLLWLNRFNVNKTLTEIGGVTLLPFSTTYWSSSEFEDQYVMKFAFDNGVTGTDTKGEINYVRAIRAF